MLFHQEDDLIANNDMHLEEDLLKRFPTITKILSNPTVEQEFDKHEYTATLCKRWYEFGGKTSLILLMSALLMYVGKLVAHVYKYPLHEGLIYSTVCAAVASPLIALLLSSLHLHEKWILARYKAERIRHWRYQQFLDGNYVQAANKSPVDFDAIFSERWDTFQQSLNMGVGAMYNFVKYNNFELSYEVKPYPDAQAAAAAMKAYKIWRLDLQVNFFVQQSSRLSKLDTLSEGLARWLLILGALVGFVEGSVFFFNRSIAEGAWGLTLAGVALFLALLSAGIRVYRSATAVSEQRERYEIKSSQLRILRERFSNKVNPLEKLQIIEEVERVLTAELIEFLRTAEKSDYYI